MTRTDAQGRALEAKKVRYVVKAEKDQPAVLEERVGDEVVRYQYSGPEDRLGRPVDAKR